MKNNKNGEINSLTEQNRKLNPYCVVYERYG